VATEVLPELAAVHWRPRMDERRLERAASLWTMTTVAHVVPFLLAAGVLVALQPLAAPVALACVAHAWVIPELYAQRGANVVRPGGRRVHCWCVRVDHPQLPTGDRVAHLLLALRADEQGFATVANQAFSGARWRVRRRLARGQRAALDEAAAAARTLDRP
jgi:hypothetical protein